MPPSTPTNFLPLIEPGTLISHGLSTKRNVPTEYWPQAGSWPLADGRDPREAPVTNQGDPAP